ncbi:MAG: trehalase family glycosidase [Lentisphaeria bacterium]
MLKEGWNTWNVRSVLSHILLPEAFAISLGVKVYSTGCCLREALIGRQGKGSENVVPGPRSYDGTYTSLELSWGEKKVHEKDYAGAELKIETAVDGGDWFAVVTPLNKPVRPAALVISGAILWNRPGSVRREGETLVLENVDRTVSVTASGEMRSREPVTELDTPYLLVKLDAPVYISSNPGRLAEAASVLARNRESFLASRNELSEVYNAMQICLAWDTIYDPFNDRVISPVARTWSCASGGWTLFDWDTYFAAWMAAVENKELAYANAVAITEEATESGFIPNMAHPTGMKTRDRSQPPVGSITIKALCEMFDETVLAARLFDQLLCWNRWWSQHRDWEGYLCWGSNPYAQVTGNLWEEHGVNKRFGGALESGLDNSPMYDDVPFDKERHLLMLADVGLMSLYIADCKALADLAQMISRNDAAEELTARVEKYAVKLRSMWCEQTGLFLNKNLNTGEYSRRLSPTHFYPLLAEVATPEQAQRMVDEHFFNPEEFWGEWILPSIARNDPAYPDQRYWRGRIWAPMNFLVYLGLRNYDLPEARKSLVEKSEALLLKEWNEKGHVHENYHGDKGIGCDVDNSDAFYHWGGLLGLISVMEGNMSGTTDTQN